MHRTTLGYYYTLCLLEPVSLDCTLQVTNWVVALQLARGLAARKPQLQLFNHKETTGALLQFGSSYHSNKIYSQFWR